VNDIAILKFYSSPVTITMTFSATGERMFPTLIHVLKPKGPLLSQRYEINYCILDLTVTIYTTSLKLANLSICNVISICVAM